MGVTALLAICIAALAIQLTPAFPLLASTRSLEAGCGLLLAFSVPSWTLVVCMKRSYCLDGTTVQLYYGSPRLPSLKKALNHHFVVF